MQSFQKFCSATVIVALGMMLIPMPTGYASQTQLTIAQLTAMESAGTLSPGVLYWATDTKVYKKATAADTLADLTAPTGSVVTSAELATLKSSNQVEPRRMYWKSDTKTYEQGQTVATTATVDATTTRRTTGELSTIDTGKSANWRVNYWDTILKKYYTGQADSSLDAFSGGTTKKITLTFAGTPTSVSVTPAELKYNKDFAVSWTFDDGYGTIYRNMYPLLNGGYSGIENATMPGLYFTDGAGNDVNFTAGEAWFARQAPDLNEMHASPDAYFWMHNDEMKEMIDHGWGVVHHGLTSAAFRDTRIANGDPLIQYPTPPGPDALNYSYEVSQGAIEMANDLGITPTTLIAPSGDNGYREAAYNQGYRFMSTHGGTYNIGGQDYVVSNEALQVDNLDTSGLVLGYRRSLADSSFTPANMMDFTTATVAQLSANDHRWISESTHQVPETAIGGSVLYSTMKSYFQTLASTYGKTGSDNVWVAGVPEVYEYQKTRNDVVISTEQSGNTVTVTIDTSQVPASQRYKALSLNVTADQALTNVSYRTGDFTHYSHNLNTKLINVDWSARWEVLADKYVALAEASSLQADVQTAQNFVDNISDSSLKTPYQNRIDAITINTNKTFLIDVGKDLSTYNTLGNWNNVMDTQLTKTDLVDTNGQVSAIDVTATGYASTDGGLAELDSTLYPYSASRDSFRVDIANPLTFTFSSLDNAKLYTFKMLGARQYGDSANTNFTIGGNTQTLQTRDNLSNNTVSISNVSPTSGSITLTVTSPIDNRGFINVIEVTEIDPSGATCSDSIKNQDETDVDCGGSTCGGCANTKVCSVNGDCTSGNCSGGVCAAAETCSDGIKNQDETDVDCGGSTCSTCANGNTCSVNGDCASGNCDTGTCAVATGPAATWYLDIGQSGFYETSDAGWNNITDASPSMTNAVDSNNNSTGVGFAATGYITRDGGYDNNGVGYPTKATHDGFKVLPTESPLVLTISGLSDAQTYDLKFFGAKVGGNPALTKFTAGGSSTTLQALGNTDQLATLSGISPSGGSIVVTVEPDTGQTWGFVGTVQVDQN